MDHSLAEVLLEAAERENVRVQSIQGRLVARGPQEAGKLLKALIQYESQVLLLLEARGMGEPEQAAVMILDAQADIIRSANEAACALIGWTPNELAGVRLSDLIYFKEQHTFEFAQRRILSTARLEHTRWRILSRTGLDIDVEMWGRLVYDYQETPVSFLLHVHPPRPQVLQGVAQTTNQAEA